MTGTEGPGRETLAQKRARKAAIDNPDVVLEAAARFLEARARSMAEVRRRLGSAGYRPDLVDGAIARLTELGILDDEAFGRAWVESRDRARPRGEFALREELRLKGLDRGLVDELLAERRERDPSGGGPDEAAAVRLIARHARALDRIAEPRLRRARAYAILARNGFPPSVCAALAQRVVTDAADADFDLEIAEDRT